MHEDARLVGRRSGLPIALRGVFAPALLDEQPAEIEVRLGERRLRLDGAAVAGERFLGTAADLLDHAKVLVRLGILRRKRERNFEMLLRLAKAALIAPHVCELVVGSRVARIDLQHALEALRRCGEVARIEALERHLE